jgi:hypothetical protein
MKVEMRLSAIPIINAAKKVPLTDPIPPRITMAKTRPI